MNEMIVCCRCKKKKFLENFNFKYKSRGIRQKACQECTRAELKNHYIKNTQYYVKKARKRNKKIRILIKQYLWSYLSTHHCVDCGENDPIVLEFDHIKDKSFSISAQGRNKTLKDIQSEIMKCEVRCANCHRRKTARQFGWHKINMPL